MLCLPLLPLLLGSSIVMPGGVAHTTTAAQWPEQVLFDESEGGAVYAVGRNWKACWSPAEMTFIPFLGSDAPRDEPVNFGLSSICVGKGVLTIESGVPPTRSGSTIHYARGSVEENYAASLDGLEQTFVFGELPERGEIVVTCSVHTDLQVRECDDGVEFWNERGSVSYTQAIARDASGLSRTLKPRWTAGSIQLLVPDDFVRCAVLPLTIDPLVQVFNVTARGPDEFAPDTSYTDADLGTAFRCDVWEIAWSLTDHDVAARRIRLVNGQVVSFMIDATPEYWSEPKIASVRAITKTAGGFLVVATVGLPTSSAREIRGRAWPTDSASALPVQTISGSDVGDKHSPDVGGDVYGRLDSVYYCAVWEIDRAGGDKDIQGVLVDVLGGAPGTPLAVAVDPMIEDAHPAISKADATFDWCIVWERRASATNRDIWARRMSYSGAFLGPAFAVSTLPDDETRPSVSSRQEVLPRFVVACERDRGGAHDVYLHVVDGSTTISSVNLTLLEGTPHPELDQILPQVDGDLSGYLVSYKETDPTAADAFQIRLTSFGMSPAGQVQLREIRVPLGNPTSGRTPARVNSVSAEGGGPPLPLSFLLVWDEPTSSGRDVLGAFFQSGVPAGAVVATCFGDGSGTPCPCTDNGGAVAGCPNSAQSNGAELNWTGQAKTTNPTLTLHAQRLPPDVVALALQGNSAQNPGVVFGDGLRCAVGTRVNITVRMVSHEGTFDYPSLPGDPPISVVGGVPATGGLRVYQIVYRDPASFCTTDTWNTTNALEVHWSN
jgi:hypothetical protein